MVKRVRVKKVNQSLITRLPNDIRMNYMSKMEIVSKDELCIKAT